MDVHNKDIYLKICWFTPLQNGCSIIITFKVSEYPFKQNKNMLKSKKVYIYKKVEVRNSRVTKPSYETELRKMMSHFELLTRSQKIKTYTSSY